MKVFAGLFLLLALAGCKKSTSNRGPLIPHTPAERTYLALGDSYTVGDGVYQEESFPFQLAAGLNSEGIKTEEPAVFANTGWTAATLISALKIEQVDGKYDIITLLIGSNDHYLAVSKEKYRKELVQLIDFAVDRSLSGRSNVFVISLPDWTVTPFGKLKNKPGAAQELEKFNDIIREEAFNASVNFVDVTPGSKAADTDPSLTSIDSLHPSGKLYSEWTRQLLKVVKPKVAH